MKLRELLNLFDLDAIITVISAENYIIDQHTIASYVANCATPEILDSRVTRIQPTLEQISLFGYRVVVRIFIDFQCYVQKST